MLDAALSHQIDINLSMISRAPNAPAMVPVTEQQLNVAATLIQGRQFRPNVSIEMCAQDMSIENEQEAR